MSLEALGMIETKGLVGSIEAADAMVKAVNHLFIYSQTTYGDVFMMDNAIPFEEVDANGRKDVLLVALQTKVRSLTLTSLKVNF